MSVSIAAAENRPSASERMRQQHMVIAAQTEKQCVTSIKFKFCIHSDRVWPITQENSLNYPTPQGIPSI
jgi:hypothetical protein